MPNKYLVIFLKKNFLLVLFFISLYNFFDNQFGFFIIWLKISYFLIFYFYFIKQFFFVNFYGYFSIANSNIKQLYSKIININIRIILT